MGTERELFYEGACSCGKGKYKVSECEPDHPWVRTGQQWYESEISCPSCSDRFVLEVSNNEVCEISKSELVKRKKDEEKWFQKRKEIMEYAATKGYLTALQKLMDNQRSVAAIYRVVKDHLHISDSEQTFRRNLKSYGTTKRWIEENISPDHLPGTLVLLGEKDSDLMDLLKETKKMRDLYHQLVDATEVRTGFKRKLTYYYLIAASKI